MTDNIKITNASSQNQMNNTSIDNIYFNDGAKLGEINWKDTNDLKANQECQDNLNEILGSLTDIEYSEHSATENTSSTTIIDTLDIVNSNIGHNVDLDGGFVSEPESEVEIEVDLDISMPILLEGIVPEFFSHDSTDFLMDDDSQVDVDILLEEDLLEEDFLGDDLSTDEPNITKNDTISSMDINDSTPKLPILTYKELQEEQSKKIKAHNTLKGSDITEIHRNIDDDEDTSLFSRLFYGILIAFVFALIGIFLDGFMMVLRSVLGQGNGTIMWMLAPLLAIIGFFIGVLSDKNAGANAVDTVNIGHSANSRVDDPSISHDILRGIGIAIAIFVVGWIVLIILT